MNELDMLDIKDTMASCFFCTHLTLTEIVINRFPFEQKLWDCGFSVPQISGLGKLQNQLRLS